MKLLKISALISLTLGIAFIMIGLFTASSRSNIELSSTTYKDLSNYVEIFEELDSSMDSGEFYQNINKEFDKDHEGIEFYKHQLDNYSVLKEFESVEYEIETKSIINGFIKHIVVDEIIIIDEVRHSFTTYEYLEIFGSKTVETKNVDLRTYF